MQMKKRGLSDVVAVTLIILLAIAAVAIVWTFVKSTLQGAGEEITNNCLSVDVKPTKCVIGSSVNVKNEAGDVTVNKVRLTYYKTDGTTGSSDSNCVIKPTEIRACPPNVPTGTTEVAVAVLMVDKNSTCPASEAIACFNTP